MRFNLTSRNAPTDNGQVRNAEYGMRNLKTAFRTPRSAHRRGAFTLVEVLAALLFMAIVIPVALQGFQVAQRAGIYGQRKLTAARIAESKLNELVATGEWRQSSLNGTVDEGTRSYRWQMRIEPWTEGTLSLLTVQVYFGVQSHEYEVHLSTLVDPTLL